MSAHKWAAAAEAALAIGEWALAADAYDKAARAAESDLRVGYYTGRRDQCRYVAKLQADTLAFVQKITDQTAAENRRRDIHSPKA